MDKINVVVYTLSTCPACRRTKEFLRSHNIEFKNIEMDTLEETEQLKKIYEVKKYNPAETFPTILCGEKIIVGFNEQKLKEALNIK